MHRQSLEGSSHLVQSWRQGKQTDSCFSGRCLSSINQHFTYVNLLTEQCNLRDTLLTNYLDAFTKDTSLLQCYLDDRVENGNNLLIKSLVQPCICLYYQGSPYFNVSIKKEWSGCIGADKNTDMMDIKWKKMVGQSCNGVVYSSENESVQATLINGDESQSVEKEKGQGKKGASFRRGHVESLHNAM